MLSYSPSYDVLEGRAWGRGDVQCTVVQSGFIEGLTHAPTMGSRNLTSYAVWRVGKQRSGYGVEGPILLPVAE